MLTLAHLLKPHLTICQSVWRSLSIPFCFHSIPTSFHSNFIDHPHSTTGCPTAGSCT